MVADSLLTRATNIRRTVVVRIFITRIARAAISYMAEQSRENFSLYRRLNRFCEIDVVSNARSASSRFSVVLVGRAEYRENIYNSFNRINWRLGATDPNPTYINIIYGNNSEKQ